ncbi:MAG: DUF885 family protein, partial [Brevundimonas sp.]|nr:DUF885 family protein [Brevundimonas sp.]
MKTMLAIGAAALLASAAPAMAQAAPPPAAEQTRDADDPALAAILADYEAYQKANNPIAASRDGDKAARARLPDASRAFELAQEPALRGFAERLAAIDPATLSDDDRLNHAFLGYLLRRSLQRIPLDTGRMSAFNSEGGPGQSFAYMAGSTRITSRDDAEAWIGRLQAMPQTWADELAAVRRGLETGMVQPRPTVESALALMEIEAAHTPATDPLLKPSATLPDVIPPADEAALRERAAPAVAEGVMPAR